MKSTTSFLGLIIILALSCTPATDEAGTKGTDPQSEPPVSAEEKAITQAVNAAYAAISFEEGTIPDYEALSALFTPDAVLQNFRGDTLESYSISEFVEGYKAGVEAGGMIAFRETELGGETEYFGKIAHRISAYASYINGASEIGERGVNSFQLLKIDGRWLISTIIWDVEEEGLAIPQKYLD